MIELLDPAITWERYRNAYYRDCLNILRKAVGPDALLMSRPVDNNLDYSPKDTVFMGWVGDEDGTYAGLKTALRYMLESGRRGYVGFGSDIGGYRAAPNTTHGRTKELFLRWTAVGALSSFMENGGGGDHLPWKFDDETTEIYRSWVNLHYKFVPYLFSEGTQFALGHNGSLMRPCDDIEALFSDSYFFGSHVFVVPVLRDPSPGQTQRLWLPRSSTGQWINYFNTSITHKARTHINEDTSRLDRIPLYVEQNTLMAMYDIDHDRTLRTFRFVLWGKVRLDRRETVLITRDGQEWLLEFQREHRSLTVHFRRDHQTSTKEEWKWIFCQYVDERELCSNASMKLEDGQSIRLDDLVEDV